MSKLSRYFVQTAVVLLGITGVGKIASVFGAQIMLLQLDPLIGIPFRYMLFLAGVMEFTTACLCLLTRRLKLKTLLIAWISTCFVVYRAGLWAIHWARPCHCLGGLTDTLHISPETGDTIMKIVLGYLLLDAYRMNLSPGLRSFTCNRLRNRV